MSQVTVSIVSHGQGDWVLRLLGQLGALCQGAVAKVVVTVNIPEGHAFDSLALPFPLEVIANTAPQGFGRNHNQAFQRCDSPWFLVLNPDIGLTGDALGLLLRDVPQTVGLIAPRVQEPQDTRPTPERDIITPWEVFFSQRTPPPAPVWFPGMFMLFRAAAYRQVAGFDERFHLYCEDFDICARTRLKGWALLRRHTVTVQHDAQRHSHLRWRYLSWHVASLLRLWTAGAFWRYWWYLKHLPAPLKSP